MNTLAMVLANSENYHKAGGFSGGMIFVIIGVLWLAFGGGSKK